MNAMQTLFKIKKAMLILLKIMKTKLKIIKILSEQLEIFYNINKHNNHTCCNINETQ